MPAPPKPSRLVQLSALAVTDDGPLPDAFRLFEQGVNESSKGPCIFDAAAAAHVFEAYRRTGVDYVIDLEHLSHDEVARLTREDATDARGWFQIELRNGELWAVNVRWTPDGEDRLRKRKQRYISPAFFHDAEGRVCELVDAALTSAPATYHALPLVAANRSSDIMDPNKVKEALEALIAGNAEECMTILKDLIALAAGAPAEESGESAPALEGAPDPLAIENEELAKEVKKFCARESVGECVAYLAQVRQTLDKIEQDRTRVELSARRELVGELVKLGAEVPATAWEGEAAQRNPVARLLSEPIVSLRARVAQLRSARPQLQQQAPKAPTQHADEDGLDEDERKLAAGMTPAQRSRFVALRRDRKGKQ